MIKTIEWTNGKLRTIDQTRLPLSEEVLECDNYLQVAEAIRELKIRGAPAIGVAAAFGVVLAAGNPDIRNVDELLEAVEEACRVLAATRPTAVNLFWALDRMKEKARCGGFSDVSQLRKALEEEAIRLWEEDAGANRKMGELGASLIDDGDSVLTHCNAGALATARYGTALGAVMTAAAQGKSVHVFVDETRPLLQGARLTAWELEKENIPMTLIADNMAGYFMGKGRIDKVFVGADRIAANGDVANKIGTYPLAILAKEHNIPFYVVAPLSTIDFDIASGDEIPIEERSAEEVTCFGGTRIAPVGVNAANPAFDVTPHRYVTAIVTEKEIIRQPFAKNLAKLARL